MRRFRRRRRRLAALALLPLAALTATTTIGFAAESSTTARIDTSARSVRIGGEVTLRGAFPGASRAPVEIRHRSAGSKSWRVAARTRTGAGGRWSVRVTPRRIGDWRAQLASSRKTQAAPEDSATDDAAAASASVDRSTGSERIRVRSRTKATVNGRHALAGRTVKIRGAVSPAGAKRQIVVRAGGETIATKARRDGEFALAWRPPSTGVYPVKVTARGNRLASGSRDSAGKITAYRAASASWYGPGLYGNRTACGRTLTASTMGVAHRTMPCGTKLRLRYGHRSVAVRVIDRGPFSGNREFDLTSATRQALGFPNTGTVLSSR